LTIKLADDTIKSLAIYNILGQTMKVMSMETANKQANLNVASLAKGQYILKSLLLTEMFYQNVSKISFKYKLY
jgi:hypothetical protein